jgi:hypothetical protein
MAVTIFVVRAAVNKDKEAAFNKWYNDEESDHLKTLIKDYDANFGETSERQRSAYVQIWP